MLTSCSAQEDAPDWHQFMGPERNGTWITDLEKATLKSTDLRKIWETAIGPGYCGPTTSGGKVYVMDLQKADETEERILCLDAASGDVIWTHTYPVEYNVGYPTGPRASVLIDGDRAYAFGTMGNLHCLDAHTGEIVWKVDGQSGYAIRIPIWGLAASPLVENDLLIVQLGGTPDACIVAFDKKSGEEQWRALEDRASYSAPIVIERNGRRILVCWTGDHLVALNPLSGEVYWKIPYLSKKSVINIATPVVEGSHIFLSSFYEGSMLVKMDADGTSAELLYWRKGESERNTDALHSIISTPFIKDQHVYGIDSYGEFRCLDLLTGDRIWTDSTLTPYGRWSNAHFIHQGGKLWAFNEKGELVLGEVSPDGFTDLGRAKLVDPVRISPNPRGGVNWAFPAFTGRRIYARSDAKLVCWEVVR
jgi:glucose dehydrogenase